MRKKILLFSALAVLCFAPAMAMAGLYLGGGLVYDYPVSQRYLDPKFGSDWRFGYNFGPVALEANSISSTHEGPFPVYRDADFKGLSLDSRFFLSQVNDPSQIYLLVGVGTFSTRDVPIFYVYPPPPFTPLVFDQKLTGYGLNLGGGLEHYLSKHVALNFGLIYRIIRYNKREIGGRTEPLSPDAKGDLLTLEAGLNYHF